MMWIHERISAVRDEHDERRVRTRVHVSAEIEVAGAHGLREALLTDLSRAGARLVSREAIGAVGETIELFLPNPRGEEIGVMGEITRSDEGPGGHTVSVRFSLVEPARQKTLEDLIGVLVAGGGGHRRKHARVARRIEVAYGSPRRIFALLGDISKGGASMTISDPLALGDEVEVAIPDGDGTELLILRGRVVSQRTIPRGGARAYRVGLAFHDMRPERRRCLEALIQYYGER